jgi:hypothetical protein
MWAVFFCKDVVTYKDEHLLEAQAEYQNTINKKNCEPLKCPEICLRLKNERS